MSESRTRARPAAEAVEAGCYPWERPLGADMTPEGAVEFRVWAPRADSVAVRLGDRAVALAPEGHGVHATTVDASAGEDYRFSLGGNDYPDPCSRWQPEGLRGPSRVLGLERVAPLEDPPSL